MVSPNIKRGKDHGEKIEAPHHQGHQAEGPAQPDDQGRDLHQGAPQASEKQDEQSHLAHQGQPGGQGDVGQGTGHFVGFQGVGAGHPRLDAGKPGLNPANHLTQQGHVPVSGGVTVRLRGDQEQEKFVVFREKIALLAQVAQLSGEKGAKGGDVGFSPFQAEEQLLEAGVQQGDVRQRLFVLLFFHEPR